MLGACAFTPGPGLRAHVCACVRVCVRGKANTPPSGPGARKMQCTWRKCVRVWPSPRSPATVHAGHSRRGHSLGCELRPLSSVPCAIRGLAVALRRAMPRVSEMVHPAGLSFAQQRKVVILRDVRHQTWGQIAGNVCNLQGGHPSRQTVANIYGSFSRTKGRVSSGYARCGRKKWKVTPEVEQFLKKALLRLRRSSLCTSTSLQQTLAREKGVQVSCSQIRRVLRKHGYQWLPRAQKRKYSPADKAKRLVFARQVLALSAAALRERLSFAMDGVVLALPPRDETDRCNFCRHGETHVWRKPCEAASPELAGDPYGKQALASRTVPMWGGVSAKGFAIVVVHKTRKLTAGEWCQALDRGDLKKAIRQLSPVKPHGPWWVLCDNEAFLRSARAQESYRKIGVKLWQIPAKSPDLNPVEQFWSWLRRKLRKLDLQDAVAKRPVLGRMAYVRRVRAVCRSQAAQRAASGCAKNLRKACQEVVRKRGAATRG